MTGKGRLAVPSPVFHRGLRCAVPPVARVSPWEEFFKETEKLLAGSVRG